MHSRTGLSAPLRLESGCTSRHTTNGGESPQPTVVQVVSYNQQTFKHNGDCQHLSSPRLFLTVSCALIPCWWHLQVEVKIRLPDRAAHERVAQLLSSGIKAVHEQENFFFDGANKELNSQRAVLRLRFYNVDKKAVITVKVRESGVLLAKVASEGLELCESRR